MFNDMELCQKIMNDIVDRTSGSYENMSYSEKVLTILVMKKIKKTMDDYMRESYPIVKAWAGLEVTDIIIDKETEPDLTRFTDNFENMFNKLMGGIVNG